MDQSYLRMMMKVRHLDHPYSISLVCDARVFFLIVKNGHVGEESRLSCVFFSHDTTSSNRRERTYFFGEFVRALANPHLCVLFTSPTEHLFPSSTYLFTSVAHFYPLASSTAAPFLRGGRLFHDKLTTAGIYIFENNRSPEEGCVPSHFYESPIYASDHRELFPWC